MAAFRGQTFIPVIGMQPVADFDFAFSIDILMKEPAITEQSTFGFNFDCKLRR